jgi:hypothetical protein
MSRAIWLVCISSQVVFAMETIYQEPVEFIEENLSGCQQQVLWMKGETKSQIEALVGHPYPGVRVRYCEKEGKTAWVLDEIGKTEPITSGIIVDHGRVEKVRVLVFRESRGSEVHRSAFTRQYENAVLESNDSLDRYIDGITGATMSVSALNHQVKLALLLDKVVREKTNDD